MVLIMLINHADFKKRGLCDRNNLSHETRKLPMRARRALLPCKRIALIAFLGTASKLF